jgi:hypothetical protein
LSTPQSAITEPPRFFRVPSDVVARAHFAEHNSIIVGGAVPTIENDAQPEIAIIFCLSVGQRC